MKTCPRCGYEAKDSSMGCIKCGTTFPKGKTPETKPRTSRNPRVSPSRNVAKPGRKIRRSTLVIVVIVAAALGSGLVFLKDRGKISKSSAVKLLKQKVTGKQWQRPSGDAQALARSMTVQQLVAAWGILPNEETSYLLHAEYARALGLKGTEAREAVRALAPYVTDCHLYLRQGAMEGLSGIGEAGLPHLIKALQHFNKHDPNTIDIRWDAAMAIGKMGPMAAPAVPALLQAITSNEENTNVKLEAAVALSKIGEPSIPALKNARRYLYGQNGLSPGETGVLKEINIALRRMNVTDLEDSGPKELAPSTSGTSVPELLEALQKDPFRTGEIVKELVRQGAKDKAMETLYAMLKEKNSETIAIAQRGLRELGAPATYAWEKNSFLPIAEDNANYIEMSAEVRGDAIYSSGTLYLGREVVSGLSRTPRDSAPLPTFVKYTLTARGGTLGKPVEKTVEAKNAGENRWDDVMVASGLGAGKYTVSLFIHAQYVKEDGTGRVINNNTASVEVEK